MAVCVIALTFDTDDDTMAPACNVHCTFSLPCRHDGEPAVDTPMHGHSVPSRQAAIDFWQARTLGQRHLVLHRGSFGGDVEHRFDETLPASCPCGAEIIEAQEVT